MQKKFYYFLNLFLKVLVSETHSEFAYENYVRLYFC